VPPVDIAPGPEDRSDDFSGRDRYGQTPASSGNGGSAVRYTYRYGSEIEKPTDTDSSACEISNRL